MKRNSLFGDELLNFDPVELEEEDDWRDVFGDGEGDDGGAASQNNTGDSAAGTGSTPGSAVATPTENAAESAVHPETSESTIPPSNQDKVGASSDVGQTASHTPESGDGDAGGNNEIGQPKANEATIAQHSLISSTSGQPGSGSTPSSIQDDKDGTGLSSSTDMDSQASSSWKNEEGDKPYREKMIQDM